MRAVIAGGSIGGLTAALALARRGHDIVLCDRDTLQAHDAWSSAFDRERSVPQYLHAHAFLARGRNLLAANAPDVCRDLLDAGGVEIDMCRPLPPQLRDPELVALVVRRPIIEWALIRALRREPRIEVRDRCRLAGLTVRRDDPSVIGGVRTSTGEVIGAELVVDAMGRNSPVGAWLADLQLPEPLERSSDCGMLYYGRYFRFRADAERPEMFAPLQAARDLGYLTHAVFWQDNDVFAVSLAPMPWDRELKVLRHPDAWMAAASALPALRPFLDPDRSEPISPVMSMGGLRNTLRTFVIDGEPVALGLVSVGDAVCHTNPSHAFGMSLAMAHGFALADAVEHADGLEDVNLSYHRATYPEAVERYEMAADTDDARIRVSQGEPIDFSSPDGNLALFMAQAVPRAILADPTLYVKYVRRVNLLDRTSVLDEDVELLTRAAKIYATKTANDTTDRAFPSRNELVSIATAEIGEHG